MIQNGGLVKSVNFKNHKYVGDPINAVKIFNEKEVDEIIILDISKTNNQEEPNIAEISEIAGEAFMPLAYGGGIRNYEQIKQILFHGAEKVILNTAVFQEPHLIKEASNHFGAQAIVVSIDVRKDWRGRYFVYQRNGTRKTRHNPVKFGKMMEEFGAGEIFLNSINQDGTFEGYDFELIKMVSSAINIPVVACGGAGKIEDFRKAVLEDGASAVAAGSYFIYQQPHRAVLISYPTIETLEKEIFQYVN